jgi:hypothetical protein
VGLAAALTLVMKVEAALGACNGLIEIFMGVGCRNTGNLGPVIVKKLVRYILNQILRGKKIPEIFKIVVFKTFLVESSQGCSVEYQNRYAMSLTRKTVSNSNAQLNQTRVNKENNCTNREFCHLIGIHFPYKSFGFWTCPRKQEHLYCRIIWIKNVQKKGKRSLE